MPTVKLALFVDVLLASLALGSSAFCFFVQSNILLDFLGSEKFGPIQTQIYQTLYRFVQVPLFGMVVMMFKVDAHENLLYSACISAVVGFINFMLVFPQVQHFYFKLKWLLFAFISLPYLTHILFVSQAIKSDRNKIGVERKADDNDSASRKQAIAKTSVNIILCYYFVYLALYYDSSTIY